MIFESNTILACANVTQVEGVTLVRDAFVLDGPLILSSLSQRYLSVQNIHNKNAGNILSDGKIAVTGAVISHTHAKPLVYSDYTGLWFRNSANVFVACLDTEGVFHTTAPIFTARTMTADIPEDDLVVTGDVVLRGARNYIVHGHDAAYPILQVVRGTACTLRVLHNGRIETNAATFTQLSGDASRRIVRSSYVV